MNICSISTAPGVGAIAIVRVSGPQAFDIAGALTRSAEKFAEWPARTAHFCGLYDGQQLVDEVVMVKFAAPHSYDGENMVEISCHGSRYIQQKIVELLISHGCRLAERGEFTLRAFMNGKMDLPQAEAVGDLIDSQSESAHRLAVSQLKGGVSRTIADLRDRFIQLGALLELELDFSEEEVEFADREKFKQLLSELREEVNRLIGSFHSGNALKNGIPVAIVGKPNVGKSTLLNALLDDDRAIVSDIPGTTRDTVEDTLTVGGSLFRIIDTAGIRQSDDTIENSGIQRSFRAMEKADVVLYLVDAADTPEVIAAELSGLPASVKLSEKKVILIINKIDRTPVVDAGCYSDLGFDEVITVSAKKRQNVGSISDALSRYAEECVAGDNTLLTNVRHFDLMQGIATDITRIEEGFASGVPTDLVAIDVRSALDKLGQLTGAISDNDLLNTIFGKFCIGK